MTSVLFEPCPPVLGKLLTTVGVNGLIFTATIESSCKVLISHELTVVCKLSEKHVLLIHVATTFTEV